MSAAAQGSDLPVRMPRARPSGRHRRPEPLAVPPQAPTLLLAVPGMPSGATRAIAEEVLSLVRAELSGLDARIGYLDGPGGEFPSVEEALAESGANRSGDSAAAVVIPLLAGPEESVTQRLRKCITAGSTTAELTDVLGPHPLLAEALHVRLSEAGLARADRARLFTVSTAADGIILTTVGGVEAIQAAEVTGVLLAARLAVPVMAAGLDVDRSVVETAERLRMLGARTLALAPCLIGPEVAADVLVGAATEVDCAGADALGAYPAVAKLVFSRYAEAVGMTQNDLRARSR